MIYRNIPKIKSPAHRLGSLGGGEETGGRLRRSSCVATQCMRARGSELMPGEGEERRRGLLGDGEDGAGGKTGPQIYNL